MTPLRNPHVELQLLINGKNYLTAVSTTKQQWNKYNKLNDPSNCHFRAISLAHDVGQIISEVSRTCELGVDGSGVVQNVTPEFLKFRCPCNILKKADEVPANHNAVCPLQTFTQHILRLVCQYGHWQNIT